MNEPGFQTLDTISAHRYYQVYSMVRQWIFEGHYAPGAKLPSEAELCRSFGVSRITARKAVELLIRENLVTSLQGKGTFVVEDLGDAHPVVDMDQLLRKVERLGRQSEIRDAAVAQIVGSDATCSDLALPKGSTVYRASRVRCLDGEPVGYIVTFVPADLGITFSAEEISKDPVLILLERKGWKISGADQLIGATLADTRTAPILKVNIGAPIVRIRMVVFDVTNRPVERMVAYYRGDRYHEHMVLGRKVG